MQTERSTSYLRLVTTNAPADEQDRNIPADKDRNAAELVPSAIAEVIDVACTWLAWDGVPRHGDGNVWTPLKALRRIQDHLLDHLAEIHSVLHAQPTIPDTWHGRKVTLDSDWARFTELDLEEASSRLRRYAKLYRVTIEALSTEQLDCRREDAWTIRQICHHVANVTYYARQMGDLSPANLPPVDLGERCRAVQGPPPDAHRTG